DPVVIPGKPNDDNIVYDIDPKTRKSASGWGHPECPGKTKEIGLALPAQYPIRRRRGLARPAPAREARPYGLERRGATGPLKSGIDRRDLSLRYRHVECVQRNRHESIEPDKVGQFCRAVLAEGRNRPFVGELRQHAAVHQGTREIISNRLVQRQIDGTLPGDDGRKFLVRQATLLTDEHMGVKLISRLKMCTGDEDCDFPGRLRQRRLVRQRPDKVPARLAERRFVQPGVPWPEQGAVVANGDEPFKTLGDALAHIVVEGALFRGKIGRRDRGEAAWHTLKFWDGNDSHFESSKAGMAWMMLCGVSPRSGLFRP